MMGNSDAIKDERLAIANEARRYAKFYTDGTDGRNTFILFAEWVESRISEPTESQGWSIFHEGTLHRFLSWDEAVDFKARSNAAVRA